MSQPRLVSLRVHPIKSLEAVEVDSIAINRQGMLEYDRSFAIFEGSGEIIKAKQNAEVHQLHAHYDIGTLTVTFRVHGQSGGASFHLEDQRGEINSWLSEYFERPVRLQRDISAGFADDWTATGPTLISTATIETVASWFDDLSADEVRNRLRSNLEIDGVPAFWEDQLYGQTEDELVRFRVGEIELLGKNSCQRCPVPSRDVESGEPTPKFAKIFVNQRKATLQPWAHPERFDHYYRVAINTQPGEIAENSILTIGDEIEILG